MPETPLILTAKLSIEEYLTSGSPQMQIINSWAKDGYHIVSVFWQGQEVLVTAQKLASLPNTSP